MRKRIAIDMDETICDTMTRHIEWYNKEFKQDLKKVDLMGKKIYTHVPAEHLARVRSYPDHAEFFMDLEPLDDAINAIKELSQKFDIYIATAAMEHPTSFTAKYNWLVEHLPFISPMNFIFCGDKGIVNADYLIDDSSRHFRFFSGQGVLFTAPHNINEATKVRVDNWQDVKTYFADKI